MKHLALILAATLLSSVAYADDPELSSAANRAFLDNNAKQPGVKILPGNIQYNVIKSGDGPTPGFTDCVHVDYSVSLINGDVADRSPGTPIAFRVNGVIRGWTEVLQQMHAGDDWRVVVPPALAYGREGQGASIPPNQTLIFEIGLEDVFSSSEPNCGQ
jgi:FKBP-type peptidyl-prolyl cis-trans isomerase FklB